MGVSSNNILDKILVTILVFAFAGVGLPLVSTYIGYMTGNLSGWALIGLFGVSGIVGMVILIGIFYGVYKLWYGGR